MFRFFVWLMTIINILIAVGFALVLLGCPSMSDGTSAILYQLDLTFNELALGPYIVEKELTQTVVAGVLLAAELVLVGGAFSRLFRRKKVRQICYKTDAGDTVLTATTVEEFMEKSLRGRSDVSDADVRVTVDSRTRHPSRVRARVVLSEATNMVEASEALRQDLRTCMGRLIPVPQNIPIEVLPRVLSVRAASRTAAEKPEPPSRPQYPIENE